MEIVPGIWKDKTIIDDELIYIPNDDIQNYPFCILKLVVETFETNQFKFNKSNQSFWAKE